MKKLENLIKRRDIYGDIVQNVTESVLARRIKINNICTYIPSEQNILQELKDLLEEYDNDVPEVIQHLENLVLERGYRTLIPPAFYDRDGEYYQPPNILMEIGKEAKYPRGG